MQGQTSLNAQPITIWLNGAGPKLAANAPAADNSTDGQSAPAQAGAEIVPGGNEDPQLPGTTATSPSLSKPKEPPAPPMRDTSPQALSSLQVSNQQLVDKIVKELDSQAHFVSYAPPKFIAFRQGIYLELSLNTALPSPLPDHGTSSEQRPLMTTLRISFGRCWRISKMSSNLTGSASVRPSTFQANRPPVHPKPWSSSFRLPVCAATSVTIAQASS